MPSAGVASKAAPATIATAMATTRQREGGRVGVPLLAPARSSTSSQSATTVGTGKTRSNESATSSSTSVIALPPAYERRSAACAVASVAETVPTSTSSATAID